MKILIYEKKIQTKVIYITWKKKLTNKQISLSSFDIVLIDL